MQEMRVEQGREAGRARDATDIAVVQSLKERKADAARLMICGQEFDTSTNVTVSRRIGFAKFSKTCSRDRENILLRLPNPIELNSSKFNAEHLVRFCWMKFLSSSLHFLRVISIPSRAYIFKRQQAPNLTPGFAYTQLLKDRRRSLTRD